MTRQRHCLADGGRHRWKYRQDAEGRRVRECQKCGVLQQMQGTRWVQIPGGPTQLPGGWWQQ
jgi:phage/plasmid primase-like uncharacterized protein